MNSLLQVKCYSRLAYYTQVKIIVNYQFSSIALPRHNLNLLHSNKNVENTSQLLFKLISKCVC